MWNLEAHSGTLCLDNHFRRDSKLVVTVFTAFVSLKASDRPIPTEDVMNQDINEAMSSVCFVPGCRVCWHRIH